MKHLELLPFRQTTPYGCGLYCMANLFNDTRYLKPLNERGKKNYHGMTDARENYILSKYRQGESILSITTLLASPYALGPLRTSDCLQYLSLLNQDVINGKDQVSEKYAIVVPVCVQSLNHKDKCHRIYLILTTEERIILLDPNATHFLLLDEAVQLFYQYKKVYEMGIYQASTLRGRDPETMIIFQNSFSHIFNQQYYEHTDSIIKQPENISL